MLGAKTDLAKSWCYRMTLLDNFSRHLRTYNESVIHTLTQSPLFLMSNLIAARSETNPFVCLSDNGIRGGLVNAQFGLSVKRAVITFSAGIIGYD